MIRVEIRETIHRPIEDVFDTLVDIPGYTEWMPRGVFLSCTQDTDGEVAVGTRYTDRTPLGPIRGEVVELKRPTRVVFHYTARPLGITVMEGWPGYELEPVGGDATRVHHVARGRLRGPFKLLRPLVQRIAVGERMRTVRGLKAVLESDASGSTG